MGDGSNLSAVLFNLCGSPKEDQIITDFSDLIDGVAAAPQLLELIQSLPEQEISGIKFIREPRGGVMVALVETFGGSEKVYDASLLSDGTLRVLSIGAALLAADEGSLVVIEEIDNGVHPSRARHLLEKIRRIAKARDLRVLLSTHNPALLDALPIEAIPSVVFCYRDPSSGSSKLVRLEEIPSYPELVTQDTLGHLLTLGLIERFAKEQRGSEARRTAAMAWLERVRADRDV
jgi:AAA15 family ATPase/GTPase